MAQQFNLTAQINLQSPKNVGRVVSDIQRQLKGSGLNTVNIKVKADPRSIAQTNRQLQNVGKNSRGAAKDINSLNRSLQEATRRFSVITLATGSLLSFVSGFKNATKAAIEFERELLKISQVTGKSVQQLQGLTKEVTRLSTAFGVSSADLLNVSRTLAQAGFNAEKTRKALDILAKTTLAATFDNIQDTTEGAIALLRQFGAEAKRSGGDVAFLEKSLDAINAVSKKFAVESGDLITVIRRVGGVFSAAGGSINELIALFTSVRATTRESAETIATGLRTIFTRIQRTDTIQQLKALNIELQDSQGRFVGAFEAVRRLSQGLSALDPRDFRFSEIVESLGGFRQIGKVIPLIQQFATAQQALTVAQNASGSTAKDAAIAQQGLGNQIAKVREEFTALIRKFSDSGPFNSIATGALKIASAMIKVAEAVEPLLPLLTTMFGLKLGRALAPGLGQLAGIGRGSRGGGGFSRFARGGMVPGSGNRDTVPAMLTPGEFVIKKSSVKSLGPSTLAAMNQNRLNHGGKPERIVAHAGGATHFTHLDKIRSVPTAFRSKMAKKGVGNIDRLYSNLGLDLPAAWNSDWSRGKDNHGVFVTQLIDYVRKNKSNSIYEETAGGKFKRGIFGTITGKARSGKLSSAYTPSDPKAASLLNDSKITNSVVKNFTAGLGAIRGKFLDTDPDVIRAGVGDILLQSLKKEDERLAATFKEISTFKTKDGGRTGIKGGEERSAASTAARRKTQFPKRKALGGLIQKFAKGGAATDTIPALLTPGEFVFNKSAAKSIGHATLSRMNKQGVQGFAKGGPVGFANGGPVNQISGVGSAADILKAAEDEIDARKKSSEEIKKNTAEEKKNTNESKKDTQGLKKHSDILSKSKDKISQFASKIQSGAASVQRIASSAQNFVFLGASIGAVTSQMSSLDDTTKQAINETAGFAAGIVGIGATVVDVFSSIITSAAAQTISSESVVRGNVEHTASSKGVVTANRTQAASGGRLGALFGGIATGVLVGLTALKFFSAKSKAAADKLEKGIDDALAGIAEGRSADAAALTQAAQEEIEQRKRSAARFSFGAATAVTSFAIAGAAIGSILGPAGSLAGLLAGGVVGGLAGAAAALGLVELGAYGEIEARKAEIDAIHKSIGSIISLSSSIYEFETALTAIDSVAGLSDEDRLKRRNLALDNAPGLSLSSVATGNEQARAELQTLAISRGKTFQGLTEQDFEGDPDAALRFKYATDLMEKSAKAAEVRFKATSKTFQLAMQTANPSKTFEELSTQAGPYKDALDAQIASIKLMTGIQIAAAQQQLDDLKATEADPKVIADQEKSVKSLEQSQKDLIDNTLEGAEAAQKVAHAQYEAARRTREASIALARSLIESGQFFDGLNKQLQSLEGEALAIDNFNAALDGAVFKFKEINIDEIDNLTNVRDLNTFAKQLGDATKGAGPEAQKYVDQLTANAAAFKKAQEGGLLGLKRDPISDEAGDAQTKKILNDLGFSADNLGVGGEEIFAEMQSKLTEALKDGVIDPSEFQSIIGPAEEANAQAVDAAKKLVEIRQKEITNLQANLAAQEKLRQKEIEFREAQIDAIRKGVQRTEKAQEILAKSIDPSAEFTPQRGVETRLQNINAQNRLNTLGMGLQAGDIGGVTRTRRNAQQRQEEIRKEIKAGGLTIEQTKALAEEQAKLAKIINTTEDELKRLADRSSEAADIQSAMEQNLRAIEKERRAREQVTGVIEDFVVGGVEARRGLVEAATGVRQAFATGTLQMQTPEQRSATVGLLDRLSDTKLLGGMTGKEIKQELVFRDAVRLGLDPELATAIALGTSTEEKLIQANENLAKKMEQLAVSMLLASQGLGNPFAAAALATGGMVQYRAGGGSIFKPKGTDTVPAMLSPGEFVIRKSAVDAIGADTLSAINNGGAVGFAKGGPVYLRTGSLDPLEEALVATGDLKTSNESYVQTFINAISGDHRATSNKFSRYSARRDDTIKAVQDASTFAGVEAAQQSIRSNPLSNIPVVGSVPSTVAGSLLGAGKNIAAGGGYEQELNESLVGLGAGYVAGSAAGTVGGAALSATTLGTKSVVGGMVRGGVRQVGAFGNVQLSGKVGSLAGEAATEVDVNEGDYEHRRTLIGDMAGLIGMATHDIRDKLDPSRVTKRVYEEGVLAEAKEAEEARAEVERQKKLRAETFGGLPGDGLSKQEREELRIAYQKQKEEEEQIRERREEARRAWQAQEVVNNAKMAEVAKIEERMAKKRYAEGEGFVGPRRKGMSSEEFNKSLDASRAEREQADRRFQESQDRMLAEEMSRKGFQSGIDAIEKQMENTIHGSEAYDKLKIRKDQFLYAMNQGYTVQEYQARLKEYEEGKKQAGINKVMLGSKNRSTIADRIAVLNEALIGENNPKRKAKLEERIAKLAEQQPDAATELPPKAKAEAKKQKRQQDQATKKQYGSNEDRVRAKHADTQRQVDEFIKSQEGKHDHVDFKGKPLVTPEHQAQLQADVEASQQAEIEAARAKDQAVAGLLSGDEMKKQAGESLEEFTARQTRENEFMKSLGMEPGRPTSITTGFTESGEALTVEDYGLAEGRGILDMNPYAMALGGPEAAKKASLKQRRDKRSADIRARRGILPRDQRGTSVQLARRQQEAGVELDPNNPINKAKYERILRTQGPRAAQRFANYSGYEPPDPRRRFTRGQRGSSSASNTDQLLQQLLQQMLRQGGGNRGGVMPRAVGRAAGGGVGGADVIPAMLTPGEFVMSAGAVRQHGVGAMRSLNKGQIPRFNRGGMVGGVAYRTLGSPNAEVGSRGAFTMDTEGLEVFQQSFDKTVQTITADLKDVSGKLGHFEMSHTFSGEVGLNVTGVNIDPKIIADQFTAAFTEMVKTEIKQAFANRSNNLQTPGEGS